MPTATRGCALAIFSTLGCPARSVSSLALALVLTGCQGLTPGAGHDPVPQGTLTANPPSLSFGKVVVGKTASLKGSLKASRSLVTVSSVTSSSEEFAVSGIAFPAAIGAGQSLAFNVTFAPQASGTATATLTFKSDADQSSSLQSLDGTGSPAPTHSVDLSWDSSQSSGVVGYNVYRGDTTGGPYSRINVPVEASTSYTDAAVSGGSTYYYVVTAVDGNSIESGYSAEAKAVIPAP